MFYLLAQDGNLYPIDAPIVKTGKYVDDVCTECIVKLSPDSSHGGYVLRIFTGDSAIDDANAWIAAIVERANDGGVGTVIIDDL